MRPDTESRMEATAGLSADKRERPVGYAVDATWWSGCLIGLARSAKPLPFGAKCPGVIRSALAADEWTECPDCGASGRIDSGVCTQCEGEGWLYYKRRLST